MAATVPQNQTLNTINQLISLASQMMAIYNAQQLLDQYWTDNGIANVLAAMGTVALNTDGTVGAADSTPVETHPLNPSTYTVLTKTLTPTQITQIKTILDAIVSLVNGNAVSAQGGARAILNAAN